MTLDISQFNLGRDSRVQGDAWSTTYGGYFSDPENISYFVTTVIPYLPKRPLDILYAASASGLLGEKLLEKLSQGTLTLVDISQKHLDANKNPNTKKVCTDLFDMNLGTQFDVVMLRSSLDYFPSPELQVGVLKNIKQHLKEGGVCINQVAYIPDQKERDIIDQAYDCTGKLGKRFFQSSDIFAIYRQACFEQVQKVGDGKPLVVTEKEHRERYGLTEDDVDRIRAVLGTGLQCCQLTDAGYVMKFEFPILLATG